MGLKQTLKNAFAAFLRIYGISSPEDSDKKRPQPKPAPPRANKQS